MILWAWNEQTHFEWAWTQADHVGTVVAAAVVALLGVGLTAWSYSQEAGAWTRLSRLSAACFRSAAWLVLTLVLLGPARIAVHQDELTPTITVLRDISQSIDARRMNAAYADDGDAPLTRAALARTTNVIQRDFALEVRDPAPSGVWRPAASTERGTDLALALRQAVERDLPAAVVLLSDGCATKGDDPREAARELGSRGVPVLVVGVGDTHAAAAARVASVESRLQVWKDEPFAVEAAVEANDREEGEFQLKLVRGEAELAMARDTGNVAPLKGQVLATASVTLSREARRVRHSFSVLESQAGRYVYEVQLSRGEAAVVSQKSSPRVTVMDRDRLRVLAIGGEPSWDFRQVERWLASELTLESTCWLQSADEGRRCTGTRPLDHPPASRDEVLWYDVILLFDPDPARMVGEWDQWLREFLERHKGGLLYQSGPRFAAAWRLDRVGLALDDVWPVELASASELEAAQALAPPVRGWVAQPVAAERDHVLLSDWGRDDASSSSMSLSTPLEVFWSSPVARRRSLARVLLEHGDPATRLADGPRPLLAAGRYGAAQVVYLGCTGVWRGRETFWRRVVQHLSEGRRWEGHRRGWLELSQNPLPLGEPLTVVARLQPAPGEPPLDEQLTGVITVPLADEASKDGEARAEIALKFLRSSVDAEEYRATWTPPRDGAWTIRLPLKDARGATLEQLESKLDVTSEQGEPRDVSLDEGLLREIAARSGGVYCQAAEARELLSTLPVRREILVSRSPPRSVWDGPWTLALLTALLGGEWWLRKQRRRV
ncbi:MAG: hypothetical protein U0939_19250 [Pirellulales bacterium]